MTYGSVEPHSHYLPWLDDPEFQETMAAIAGHTLVDPLRCYELWQLVHQAAQLPGEILEVGVWRGGTGAILCRRAPHKRVYLADTFLGVVKAGENDRDYRSGEHADTSLETVQGLLGSLNAANGRPLVGIFPDDFDVKPEAYCFVHIDVDVYDSAAGVMAEVWPKLSRGGIVVFDDFGFETTGGVTKLVNEMTGSPDRVVIYNLNGHAVVVKTA
jgi:O-methyltransferase